MWRRAGANYWNESPFFLALFCAAGVGWLLGPITLADLHGSLGDLLYLCSSPWGLGVMGLIYLSAWALFHRRDREGERALQTCGPLRASQLVPIWLVLVVIVAGTVEAITWLAFGVSILNG